MRVLRNLHGLYYCRHRAVHMSTVKFLVASNNGAMPLEPLKLMCTPTIPFRWINFLLRYFRSSEYPFDWIIKILHVFYSSIPCLCEMLVLNFEKLCHSVQAILIFRRCVEIYFIRKILCDSEKSKLFWKSSTKDASFNFLAKQRKNVCVWTVWEQIQLIGR